VPTSKDEPDKRVVRVRDDERILRCLATWRIRTAHDETSNFQRGSHCARLKAFWMTKSNHYRANAERCERKANADRDPKVRAQLEDFADQWRYMAAQAERLGI
jgi:hypothetical protein